MSDWTFIYALVDPRDGRVRYVGKSNRPYSRATQHLNANAHTNGRKAEWTSDLGNLGTELCAELRGLACRSQCIAFSDAPS